ncbi:hypothetical protein KIH77_07750 [Bifidobacterium sp. 82T24]|uniref:hypothetical protein n=1 Tax=Bifidobacterium pluvialisilvae TaxID=2834436 RepID=UPI001C57D8C5|nr:hypothetical protein [Bifidobacterium pluvialisilvae]MBW3088620.1 hypothetical protein [Bifidobacterium pluvialisilvae]
MPSHRAGDHIDDSYRGGRASGANMLCKTFCVIAGVLAVLAGAAAAVRAIAPAALPIVGGQSTSTWLTLAVIAAVATLIFVIIARVTAPIDRKRGAATTWGVIAIVLSLLLSCLGFLVGNMFNDGIVKPAVRDEAPISDTTAMQTGMEGVFGACTSDWQSINASQYPGVKSIAICKQTRVAYAVFDNDSAINLYKTPLATQASKLLDQYSGEVGDTKYAMLIGKRWVIVGEQTKIEKLQRSWGGTINTIE